MQTSLFIEGSRVLVAVQLQNNVTGGVSFSGPGDVRAASNAEGSSLPFSDFLMLFLIV